MTGSGMKVFILGRRSLSVREILKQVGNGVAEGGSPEPMHWAAISDLRLVVSASNLFWMRS